MQIIIEYMYSCFGAIILFTLLFSRTIQIETIVRGRGGGGGQTLIHFVCQKEIATVRWISLLS